jgi:hypothetical protein
MTEENLPKPILIKNLGTMYPTESSKRKTKFGVYKCGFCGTEFRAITDNVVQGKTMSCGCYNKRRIKETHKTHGLWSTKLYKIWGSIKNRVFNIKNKAYKNYGGRGITICDEWKNDAEAFYNWAILNGYEENKGLSIDRIDNDGDYCPENCRWTTRTIQMRNRRLGKDNTSGFKGVGYHKKNNKYVSCITVDKNKIYLGSFQTAEEGAIAYNNYIIENNLEGYILNEIPERA